MRDKAKIPLRKIRMIDNAVLPAPEVLQAELEARRAVLGIAPDDLVIGSVGRVVDSHKRFSDLVRALALLRAEHRGHLRLLIVGDGPDLPALRALAQELGVGEAVIFAGYQGEVRRFYPLMDVFALASAHEAFGLVLVEAMLAGVPIVATNVGGIPHVLDQGRVGTLVPPSDPVALASGIGTLLADAAVRQALGEAGHRRAEEAFSAERYCHQIDMLYRDFLP